LRDLAEKDVRGFSCALKDDAAVGFNDVDGTGVEIEQANVEAARILPSLLFDKVAQFPALRGGKPKFRAALVAAAARDKRQKAHASHSVVPTKVNHPEDDIKVPSDNRRLH
jgi:hypothetical protein